MAVQPVLINGQWRAAKSSKQFHGENPATGEAISFEYPISDWADVDAASGQERDPQRLPERRQNLAHGRGRAEVPSEIHPERTIQGSF